MTDGDDFYYRRKPHASIVRRANMSPEVRSASYTYEDHMHARDGTLPDERTPKGMAWHQTALGMRNSRSIHRVVAELLECGDLHRLGDGRLTSADVQRELASRARKRGGGSGSGGAGGGGESERARQLVLIEGGRLPHAPVDKPGDIGGEPSAAAEVGPMSGRTSPDVRPNLNRCRPKNPMNSMGAFPHHSRAIANQMVVVAESRFSARARGDPVRPLA